MMRTQTIYMIRNTANDKVYVGVTRSVESRFQTHRTNLRKNQHINERLQADWNQYGEMVFEFSVIKTVKIFGIAAFAEERRITTQLQAFNPAYGYNKSNAKQHQY